MWVRLKDENGIVSLVNLSQAKYIQQGVDNNNSNFVRVVWQHDTFSDHGDSEIPDESCVYSEQMFTGLSVLEIEQLLIDFGMTTSPVKNSSENIVQTAKSKSPVKAVGLKKTPLNDKTDLGDLKE